MVSRRPGFSCYAFSDGQYTVHAYIGYVRNQQGDKVRRRSELEMPFRLGVLARPRVTEGGMLDDEQRCFVFYTTCNAKPLSMGLRMDDIHAPTIASGPTSQPTANGTSKKQTLQELSAQKENLEAELSALSSVLDSVSSCCKHNTPSVPH
jgi:hypothetical protein